MKQKGFSRRDFVKQSTLAAISISPAVNALAKFTGTKSPQWFIDCAFRLTNYKTLLNLEFYFVNVKYKDGCITKKLKFFYGQEESYMIVRLPQQHIAEQSYDVSYTEDPTNPCVFDDTKAPDTNWTAITRISGYSYLVFRIQFQSDKRKIKLSEKNLLDWNNQQIFRLVVRQNLNESIFEIKTNSGIENHYPFGYNKFEYKRDDKGNTSKELKPWESRFPIEYDYDAYPKAYGDPITVIEVPWRLILSPKLPDQDRFRWKWGFSKKPNTEKTPTDAELWFASLTIEEIPEYQKQLKLKKQFQEKPSEPSDKLKVELEQIISKIELMILGSPDSPIVNPSIDDIFNKTYSSGQGKILPSSSNRNDLVELYIKYKLVARTEKLIFSPLGVSTFIEFKNEKIEETTAENVLRKIFLVEWKHLISLGRDEEVEVITLIIDKEASHKYLHIQSSKRRTKKGLSYLDYREYIMPLTIFVNFEEHQNEKSNGETISKFKSPFKSFEIKEVKPKRICPLASMTSFIKNVTYKENGKGDDKIARIYYPQTFNPETKKAECLTFEYEAIDWQEQPIKFKKKLQAIELSINDAIKDSKTSIKEIDDFFDSQNNATQKIKEDVRIKYDDLSKAITDKINTTISDVKKSWQNLESAFNFYKKTILEISASKLNELFNAAIIELNKKTLLSNTLIDEVIKDFQDLQKEYFKTVNNTEAAIKQYIDDYKTKSNALKIKIENQITDGVLQLSLLSKLLTIYKTIENIEKSFNVLKEYFTLDSKIKDDICNINTKWQELKATEREYINQINLYQKEIIYSVKDLTREIEDKYKETTSNLKTDFVLFKGQLKERTDNTIDFFSQYASIPQLQKAQVYINSLNKIVNEEIPVEIKYANDYINNQIDLAKFEVEKNASKVFGEITESSREYLKGKIRNVAADMGGYINPELPVEFLTYLKDPNKLKQDVLDKIKQETGADIQQEYNDLVFLSQQAKDAWNTAKSINPKQYFQDLKAKILGSIDLTDIIKTDFELPRLTNNGDNITYTFITDKITPTIELGPITFYNRNKKAQLEVFLQKSLREPQKYRSYTKLSSFSIGINQPFPKLFTILFDYFLVESSSESSKKNQVKILDVAFDGPLSFLGKLAEAIKIPGTGLRIIPSLRKVEIGYTFSMPGIETPTFNFTNLKFDIGLRIPFPTGNEPEPLTTTFSINKPEDKFLITVGIFGGRGHFVIEATPKKIVKIDSAIEFGGYLGINLGIAAGYVYLFAGIRYIYTDGQSFSLSAYIICGGGVTVFGFISVSVTFLMALQYEGASNTLYGTASVSYCIKIAFFKKSFTLSYSKRISGAGGKPVNPDNSEALLYNQNEDEVLYAYTGTDLLLAEPKNYAIESPTKSEIQNDLKSFKNIYSKKTWNEYCHSFNF